MTWLAEYWWVPLPVIGIVWMLIVIARDHRASRRETKPLPALDRTSGRPR